MKKLALLLVITATLSFMAGCSKSSSTAATATPVTGVTVTAVATPGAVSVVTAK